MAARPQFLNGRDIDPISKGGEAMPAGAHRRNHAALVPPLQLPGHDARRAGYFARAETSLEHKEAVQNISSQKCLK
jgi:hypothetical protein